MPALSTGAVLRQYDAKREERVCSSAFSADEQAKGKNSEVIETITVTAERRSQSIQKLPASIQAFSAEDLASAGIDSIEALQNATPGLVMSNNGGQGHAYIRGIGTDIIGGGIEGGVAVYVDGVYQSRPTSLVSQFVDVERIEVLKGPQGTLYGRNATGGAINIITQAPSKVSEGQFDVELGRFGEKIVRGTFSGPLSDGVASGRLSILSSKTDGFMKNILLNNRNDSDTDA
ncbi:MAG: TonB-dependent receptor, partial [Proteobacteria bacterium]|nr:TonB-dependent receptor [Pseudomonadota bacterium]